MYDIMRTGLLQYIDTRCNIKGIGRLELRKVLKVGIGLLFEPYKRSLFRPSARRDFRMVELDLVRPQYAQGTCEHKFHDHA